MVRILDQNALRNEEMQKCLDAVTRTEETLVQFKRKGAAGDIRKKLQVDSNI